MGSRGTAWVGERTQGAGGAAANKQGSLRCACVPALKGGPAAQKGSPETRAWQPATQHRPATLFFQLTLLAARRGRRLRWRLLLLAAALLLALCRGIGRGGGGGEQQHWSAQAGPQRKRAQHAAARLARGTPTPNAHHCPVQLSGSVHLCACLMLGQLQRVKPHAQDSQHHNSQGHRQR